MKCTNCRTNKATCLEKINSDSTDGDKTLELLFDYAVSNGISVEHLYCRKYRCSHCEHTWRAVEIDDRSFRKLLNNEPSRVRAVRESLVAYAKVGKPQTYKELSKRVDPGKIWSNACVTELNRAAEFASEREMAEGRPPLIFLLINKKRQEVQDSTITWAERNNLPLSPKEYRLECYRYWQKKELEQAKSNGFETYDIDASCIYLNRRGEQVVDEITLNAVHFHRDGNLVVSDLQGYWRYYESRFTITREGEIKLGIEDRIGAEGHQVNIFQKVLAGQTSVLAIDDTFTVSGRLEEGDQDRDYIYTVTRKRLVAND